MTLTLQQTGWILALLALLATVYLWKLSRGKRYPNFDWVDLITSRTGYIDQSKLHTEGAFLVSTYGFLYLLWEGKLTEWYFGAYMAAWVVARAYALKKTVEGDKDASATN